MFTAAYYLVAAATPAAILVRQALRGRRTPEGGTDWYSGGNLLLWLAGLGVAGVLGTVGVSGDIRERRLIATIREWMPNISPVGRRQLGAHRAGLGGVGVDDRAGGRRGGARSGF